MILSSNLAWANLSDSVSKTNRDCIHKRMTYPSFSQLPFPTTPGWTLPKLSATQETRHWPPHKTHLGVEVSSGLKKARKASSRRGNSEKGRKSTRQMVCMQSLSGGPLRGSDIPGNYGSLAGVESCDSERSRNALQVTQQTVPCV